MAFSVDFDDLDFCRKVYQSNIYEPVVDNFGDNGRKIGLNYVNYILNFYPYLIEHFAENIFLCGYRECFSCNIKKITVLIFWSFLYV